MNTDNDFFEQVKKHPNTIALYKSELEFYNSLKTSSSKIEYGKHMLPDLAVLREGVNFMGELVGELKNENEDLKSENKVLKEEFIKSDEDVKRLEDKYQQERERNKKLTSNTKIADYISTKYKEAKLNDRTLKLVSVKNK